jgi:ABC-type phosphate/phosphonate transport system permease subunit
VYPAVRVHSACVENLGDVLCPQHAIRPQILSRATLLVLAFTLFAWAGSLSAQQATVIHGVSLRILYASLTSMRSIPDLTLAIFCAVLVGLGPAAGTLALTLFYDAALTRLPRSGHDHLRIGT